MCVRFIRVLVCILQWVPASETRTQTHDDTDTVLCVVMPLRQPDRKPNRQRTQSQTACVPVHLYKVCVPAPEMQIRLATVARKLPGHHASHRLGDTVCKGGWAPAGSSHPAERKGGVCSTNSTPKKIKKEFTILFHIAHIYCHGMYFCSGVETAWIHLRVPRCSIQAQPQGGWLWLVSNIWTGGHRSAHRLPSVFVIITAGPIQVCVSEWLIGGNSTAQVMSGNPSHQLLTEHQSCQKLFTFTHKQLQFFFFSSRWGHAGFWTVIG